MPFAEDLTLGPIEQVNPSIPEKVAATKAFYAAATNEDTEDPIAEYQALKTELETQGYSKNLETAQNKWVQEQDDFGKQYFTNLIADPSIDIKTKKDALSLYTSSGYINPSLREKYLEQVAVKSPGNRIVDNQALDELLKAFPEKRTINIQETLQQDIDNAEIGVKDWVKGLGYVGADIIKSIPATVWGAIQGIWDKDLITGREVTTELLQNWASNPQDPGVQSAYNKILDKLSFLEIPYDKALSYTLKNTGSEQLGIVAGIGAEAITGGLAVKGLKSVAKLRKAKGTPELKKGTPLDQTNIANPKAAGELAASAVKDATGQIAIAVGEDAGTIVSNMVFPKPFKQESRDNNPSIHKRLKEEISELDKQVLIDLENFRWDPNIYDADLRKSDYDTILKTTREVDTPTYMPANSTLSPTNTATYVGKAVFGRDTDLFYHSRNEVLRAYESLNNKIKSIPEELNTKVSIVDKLTGQKYTPEELMADSKFKSGLDRLVDIPNITENGIPVKVGKTGKTREDGTYVAATLRKNPDGSPKEISIDVDAIKTQFNDKPWTKPKVEGVNPFPEKLFKTPEEWAKFIYLHEEAHIEYPNLNGTLSKADYENLVNQKALEKFNSLKDKSWETQPLAAKQFAVEMEWSREYDDLSIATFGTNAVDAQLEFGIDVSGIARSGASQWIFGGNGIFPTWFERSGARAAPRAARQASTIINTIKKKIAGTPYRKELNSLVEKAEADGKENFTISQIQDMFPSLKKKQVEELFETHTYWRRVNHYNHALINTTFRNDLVANKFTNGLFIDGKYKGAVNSEIKFSRDNVLPKNVWDFDKDLEIKFTLDVNKELATDIGGKRLVLLRKPFTSDDGKIYGYALVGGEKSKIDYLPEQVVPRLPGYSPIKTTAAWYIDVIPTSAEVNGYLISDPARLRALTKTLGAGVTKKDAKALEAELKAKYPTSVVQTRQEKNVTFNRIMADQEAHQEVLKNAIERGERLPTLNGPAPIEDRLTSLVKSVQTLTRQMNMQAYSRVTEEAFVRNFARFLPEQKFPETKSDIKPLSNMSPEETAEFETALTVWDQYSKVKSFGSFGDRAWADVTNRLADMLENYNVTYKLAPGARKIAEQGNILVNYPRQLASILFITLNPLRQWLVQPAQLFELWAINPQTAIQRFADLTAIRVALASKSELMTKSPVNWYESARALAPSMDKVEFDKTIKAIEDSGILQGVDLNMLVHGIFSDIDRPLIEGKYEKVYNDVVALPKGVTRLSRSIGFDFAELTNQLGTWLVMKDKWIQNNLGKDWTTKVAQEEIAYNTYRWSGSMTRAGAYPYQQGAFSVLMQFAAITQKMTMNLVQKNGLLTSAEKARLIAARATLWGAKYGLPGGALIYYFVDRLSDDEENIDIKQNADIIKRGLADRALDSLFNALSGSDNADLLVSKGMSPYSESTTGIPYVELVAEFAKLWDGKDATNPRLPGLGALSATSEAIGKMRSWFVTKDVTNENVFKRTMMEAFTVASSMNNFGKGQLMLSTKDKITKTGNSLGLDFTASEAYAQMFGIGTWKEDELWNGIGASMDRKQRIEDMATNIHKWMENQMTVMKSEDPITRFDMLTSFVTMLKDDKNWTDQDIQELYESVIEKTKRTSKDTNTSLLEAYIKAHRDKNSEELNRVKGALATNPKNKELLDILDGKGNP